MRKLKKQNAITLVALVITIVILLILAGISISALTNTGIFAKAKEAKSTSENAEKEQSQILSEYEKELNKYIAKELTDDKINTVLSKTENTVLKDANGNIFTLPAGFKVVVNDDTNNAKTVDKGIVIEDATDAATKGSQFVWVPLGNIVKADGSKTEIELGRYDFDETTGKESAYAGKYVEEDASDKSTLKNIEGKSIAKNITNFKNSVSANGGYYIGRYEARTTTPRSNKEDTLTQITEKGTDQVYNYVTQSQAAQQTQNMYNSSNFTSDLINGYAWDTATLFLQSCGEEKYSRKTSVNSSFAVKGTNEQNYIGTRDNACNVYDLASNLSEWTAETSDDSIYPCVYRGGNYSYNNTYTTNRNYHNTFLSTEDIGFRPILYL